MSEENKVIVYDAASDYEMMRPQDKIVSRLRLQQALSPAVNAGKMVQGCWAIDDNEVGIERGATTLIVPVMVWFQWVEFNPDMNADKKDKILAKSIDPTSELAKAAERYDTVINPDGKKVFRVTESYNFAVLCPTMKNSDWERLFVVSFQRSAHKLAKGWWNRMSNMRLNGEKLHMWRNTWELGAEFKDEGPKKKYFLPTIDKPLAIPENKWAYLSNLAIGLRAQRAALAQRELDRAEEDAEEAAAGKDEPHF